MQQPGCQGAIPQELTIMMEEGIPFREFWVLGEPIIGYLSFNRELSQIMGLYVDFPRVGAGKVLLDKGLKGEKISFNSGLI